MRTRRRERAAAVAGAAMLALALAGCGGRRESVTAAGSTAFQPFAEKLADQYMAARPGEAVTIQGGGSAVGIQSALSGAADIGMADLVRLPPEAGALKAEVVARDGIALVVHPSNPVSNLTLDQVRGLFSGDIRSWKEVGGADEPVTIVSREAGSGTRSSFEEIVGGIRPNPDAIVQDSNGTIRETVGNDARAIGYLSHGLINEKVKALTVDGHACTTEEIVSGGYALVRPVFFLTRGDASPAARAFIAYVLSPEAQAAIREDGLIPAK
jgi:phosphate transport system substrate-binding protein